METGSLVAASDYVNYDFCLLVDFTQYVASRISHLLHLDQEFKVQLIYMDANGGYLWLVFQVWLSLAERHELWKLHSFCFFRWVLTFPSSCLQYVWPHISWEAFLIPSEVKVSKNVIEKTSLLRIFFLRIVIKRETRALGLKSTCYFPCGSHMCNIGMFLWIVCIFFSQTPVFKQMWKQHNTAV